MFECTGSKIAKRVQEISDEELQVLFSEIYTYRQTGVLVGENLKALAAECFGSTSEIRTVEDFVLFEMARRHANDCESREKQKCGSWRNAKTNPPPMYELVIGSYKDTDVDENGVESAVREVGPVYRHESGYTRWGGYGVTVRKWMPFPEDKEVD